MRIKKNQSGMTLVEVVIALGVFSFTFLGVTMCLAAALKLNNRNMLRDRELNVQQKAIEEHKAEGVALLSTGQGGLGLGGNKIVFGNTAAALENGQLSAGVGTLGSVTLFHAVKTAAQGNTYNFEIKGISSPRNTLGNSTLEAIDKSAGIYHLHVISNYTGSVDVIININGGEIFEGSHSNGYVNTSSIYARTLAPAGSGGAVAGAMPSELLVGYANSGTVNDIKITCNADNGTSFTQTINAGWLTGPKGAAYVVIDSGGNCSACGAGENP